MVLEPILCSTCGQDDIVKHCRSGEGKQRYKCRYPDCTCQTFILDPSYRGRLLSVKQTIVDMAMNGSGIRDTARVLQQRWLWHAMDYQTGEILAYVLADHKDQAFLERSALLEPFGISQYYTDDWGAYDRHLAPALHTVGKRHTQKIERKYLTLRTRIKRLTRKTICFSKTILMHDTVIGLFINRYEFGLPI